MIRELRDKLAADLAGALGTDVDVVPNPRTADQPVRPRVVVAVKSADPGDTACPWPTVACELWAVTELTEPGPADDAVDALCDRVIAALDAHGYEWTAATRGVWNELHPAYRVDVNTRE